METKFFTPTELTPSSSIGNVLVPARRMEYKRLMMTIKKKLVTLIVKEKNLMQGK